MLTRTLSGNVLFGGQDLNHLQIGWFCQELSGLRHQCRRDGPVQMGLPSGGVWERVKDAERRGSELYRIPCLGGRLCLGERKRTLEKILHRLLFAGLSLQACED